MSQVKRRDLTHKNVDATGLNGIHTMAINNQVDMTCFCICQEQRDTRQMIGVESHFVSLFHFQIALAELARLEFLHPLSRMLSRSFRVCDFCFRGSKFI